MTNKYMGVAMESLFHNHVDAFNDRSDRINAIDVKRIALKNEEWFSKQFPASNSNLVKVLCIKYQSILDGLVFTNSFIGNEFMHLQYTMHQLCIWNAIATDGKADHTQQNICKAEIQLLFYTLVNLIYNIKEKLSDLCSFAKGEEKDQLTIINENARNQIKEVFSREYQNIADYCRARRWLVHKSYSILYLKETQTVRFYYTELDFSRKRVDTGEKEILDFIINQEGLIIPLEALERAISTIIRILSDLQNIDPQRLLDKFRTTFNSNPGIQITL